MDELSKMLYIRVLNNSQAIGGLGNVLYVSIQNFGERLDGSRYLPYVGLLAQKIALTGNLFYFMVPP